MIKKHTPMSEETKNQNFHRLVQMEKGLMRSRKSDIGVCQVVIVTTAFLLFLFLILLQLGILKICS